MLCRMRGPLTERHLELYQKWFLEETRGLEFSYATIDRIVQYILPRMGWLKQRMVARYISFLSSLKPSLWDRTPQNLVALQTLRTQFLEAQDVEIQREMRAAQARRERALKRVRGSRGRYMPKED